MKIRIDTEAETITLEEKVDTIKLCDFIDEFNLWNFKIIPAIQIVKEYYNYQPEWVYERPPFPSFPYDPITYPSYITC